MWRLNGVEQKKTDGAKKALGNQGKDLLNALLVVNEMIYAILISPQEGL